RFLVSTFSPSKITLGKIPGNFVGSYSGSMRANLFFGIELVVSAKLAMSRRNSKELFIIRLAQHESVQGEPAVRENPLHIVDLRSASTTKHIKRLIGKCHGQLKKEYIIFDSAHRSVTPDLSRNVGSFHIWIQGAVLVVRSYLLLKI